MVKLKWKIVLGIILISTLSIAGCMQTDEPDWEIVEAENEEIKIPISEVNDSDIHYYKLKGSGSGKFFVFRNPSGNFTTRISLCEPCGGRSFHFKDSGNKLVCDKCGTVWKTNDFEGISGGCQNYPPPFLEHVEENGTIIIKGEDLQ